MKLVAQQDSFGCGLACVASLVGCSYEELLTHSDKGRAQTTGFYCRDLVAILHRHGLTYKYKYVNSGAMQYVEMTGSIVFIKRSKDYPAGHYLLKTTRGWMDPWVNFKVKKSLDEAVAGYINRLPGQPIYVLYRE